MENNEERRVTVEKVNSCVELILKDVLNQGGLIYTVTSLPAYIKAFFCTLPEGRVKVTVINKKIN